MKIKLFIATLMLLVSSVASAIELDEAKDKGYVGEQTDGYLGIVQAAPEVTALVRDVNDKRREKYQQLAKQNNITLAQVEALAGKKAVEKTQPGHYVLLNGDWVKK
ncbi:YdbL family probable chaperone protein [Bowmanella dokdonensis]|uniref:YdbL family protein n=1 Tax=Bowmanella dokdonensis TaxID=751969 RepID=A0A939DQK4_9ALTE|nr:YdbL family protein [Bowmanella dokdonensis]MBN7826970.1 YdbL family protein [Bowmanella dokdonensis]